jgi:hypothetical protein
MLSNSSIIIKVIILDALIIMALKQWIYWEMTFNALFVVSVPNKYLFLPGGQP